MQPVSRPQNHLPKTRRLLLAATALALAAVGLASSPAAAAGFSCQITATTADSLTVQWTAVPGVTNYQYKLAVQGVGNRYRLVSGTSAVIPVSGDARYTISMAPRVNGSSPPRVPCGSIGQGGGGGEPAPPPPNPNPQDPPSQPEPGGQFSCSVRSVESGVVLSWNRAPVAIGYQYRWRVGSGGNRYSRINGNGATSLRLPVPPGQPVEIQMAPLYVGRSVSRVACGSSRGGQGIDVPAGPAPSAGTSASYPIRSNGDRNQANAGPQCVNPSYNDNFPGLRYGDFLLKNNAWNADAANGSWWQCISLLDRGDNAAPHWNYKWLGETDVFGSIYQVRSFPEVIYGTKSAFEASGTFAELGLPARYGDLSNFGIDYAFSSNEHTAFSKVVNGRTVFGEKNVAIESFFHSSCNIQRGVSGSNRELEVMVWLEGGPERKPDGAAGLKTEITIDGERYQVWTKGAKDPGYIAFYALNPKRSGSLDWNKFIDWTRTNGARYGMKPFNDNWCMGNIIFGTEIWWGKGTFTLDRFDITRR